MAQNFCGIHIGDDSVNALVLRPGKRSWAVAGSESLLIDQALEDPATSLKAISKSLKLSGATTTLCLPKQLSILRHVRLPSVDNAELAQMARFETERHIPLNAERFTSGYHIIRKHGVEGSDVLLGAVDGPIVENLLTGAVGAGLKPRGVTVTSTALVNSLLHNRRSWAEDKTVALLGIGLDALDIVMIDKGRILFGRSVGLSLRGLLEAWAGYDGQAPEGHRPELGKLAVAGRMMDCLEKEPVGGGEFDHENHALLQNWLQKLTLELGQTYDYARREMQCPSIEAIAVTGEGAVIRHLKEYLAEAAGIPVEVFNPVSQLEGEKKGFVFDGFEHAIGFGAVLGFHGEKFYKIDLTPEVFYRNLARRQTGRQLISTAVIFLIMLGVAGYAFMQYQEIRAREVEDYRDIIGQMRPRVENLQEMKAKLEIIRGFTENRTTALKVLNDIVGAPTVPSRVSLTRIEYNERGVVLEGYAKATPDLSNFIASLEATGDFSRVERSQEDPQDLFGQPVRVFRLDLTLSGPEAGGR